MTNVAAPCAHACGARRCGKQLVPYRPITSAARAIQQHHRLGRLVCDTSKVDEGLRWDALRMIVRLGERRTKGQKWP